MLPTLDPAAWTAALARVDLGLNQLVPVLMAHLQGDAILGCHRWRGRMLGPQRLLVRLVDGPGALVVWRVLDLCEGCFLPIDDIDEAGILDAWPFGFELTLQDLDGLFSGTLVIWDVLGLALRHWSASGPGMASFLCAVFSEAVRPGATSTALAHQLTELGVPTETHHLRA